MALNRQVLSHLQEGFVLASKPPTGSGAEDTVSREDVLALFRDVQATVQRLGDEARNARFQ